MDAKTLHDRLKAAFGDAVLALADPPGDPPCIRIAAAALPAIARELKTNPEFQFDFLECLSGVDYGTELGVTYHLFSYAHRHQIALNVRVGREKPAVPSVDAVWAGANWHEREAYDLFGIVFEGSRDLRRILTAEGWEGHPLRKDYRPPDSFQGIPLT
jgi:NADH-quinone oxidoreductase subunit C